MHPLDIPPEIIARVEARCGRAHPFEDLDPVRTAFVVIDLQVNFMATPAARARRVAAMTEGSPGHALWPELDVRPEDETVLKRRFSAFIQGSSDLTARLRARGFDTVLIGGTVTNVCCESSARDAMMLDFRTIMVADCNAANSDAEHNAALAAFWNIFGDVMITDHVIERLRAGAAGRAAA